MATTPHRFDPGILREYDIRGIIDKTLSTADATALGRALGTFVRRRGGDRVAVGRDGRLSSPTLSAAVCEGLRASGIDVVDVGLGPTPMLYFAVKHLKTDAGIMVTGSHNPPEYNGFKMTLLNAPLFGERIQELGELAAAGDFETGQGDLTTTDVRDAYIRRLVRDYRGDRQLSIAWDAGNGSVGEILPRLTDQLPGRHILLYEEVNGTFPNHHPDPTVPENLRDLQKAVAAEGCDLGVAFDGDGDRIGAIDETGNIVWGDQLLAIYAEEVLAENPGATIIADVKASQTLFDEVARLGGKPLMWRTGHSLIKDKMAETGSPLAGEMSGHIFFADKYYGFDDAPYCAVRLAGILARSDEPLSARLAKLPVMHNTPETRFEIDEHRKFEAMREIAERVKAHSNGADVNDLDGVRVTNKDGWWLLRASNTQNVLVARAEAYTPEGLERLKQAIVDNLRASDIPAPEAF